MIYDIYDLVVAAMPYSEKSAKAKPRPLVIVSSREFNRQNKHVIICMVTTALLTKWYGDIKIENLTKAGLKRESFIRPKFYTLDNRLIKKKIGTLSKTDAKNLKKHFGKILFA